MPESRQSRFSRVRSPTSMARVEPRRTASTSPRRTRSPSSWRGSTSTSADPSRSVTARNTTVASGSPATTPSARATTCAVLRWAAGMVAAVVTSRPGKPPRSSSRAIPTTAAAAASGKRCRAARSSGSLLGHGAVGGREEVLGGGRDRLCTSSRPRRRGCGAARMWPRQRASSRSGKSERTCPPRVSSRCRATAVSSWPTCSRLEVSQDCGPGVAPPGDASPPAAPGRAARGDRGQRGRRRRQ